MHDIVLNLTIFRVCSYPNMSIWNENRRTVMLTVILQGRKYIVYFHMAQFTTHTYTTEL